MFIGNPSKIVEDDRHPDWAPTLNLPNPTTRTDRLSKLNFERYSRRLRTKEKGEQLDNVNMF